MSDLLKKISPVYYVLIILSFFLTFVNISCAGTKIASLSGFDLAFGTTITMPGNDMFNKKTETKETPTDAEPLAIVALVLAVAGIVLSFLRISKQQLILLILGIAGFVIMLLLKSAVGGDITKQPVEMLEISYGFGYYLSLILFMVSSISSGAAMYLENKETIIQGLPEEPLLIPEDENKIN
jgi:hypothetical protein